MTVFPLQTRVQISRRGAPEALLNFAPLETEGAGKAGCALHPRSRVQICARKNAHEHTGSAEAIRPSLRNGFTAYAALSSATNSFCHRHRRIEVCRTRLGRRASADLASATDARTTRFCRTRKHRSSARRSATHGSFANPPCDHITRLTPPRPPHPAPRQ
jgi:hypothetical protein